MKSTSSNVNITSTVNLVTNGWEESEAMTKDTFMEEVESYTTFKIAAFLINYWFPVLVPIGLVGNTLSFLVMMKSNNRKMSTCIYMAAISINDNIMMFVCLHYHLVSGLQIHNWYQFECNLHGFVGLFALQNCTFLVLAMTADKYIAIKWPHKAATYSTQKELKRLQGLCISVYVFTIFPIFFFQGSLVTSVSTLE